jgi:hypothetical protein
MKLKTENLNLKAYLAFGLRAFGSEEFRAQPAASKL